jgi:hypothetical protein
METREGSGRGREDDHGGGRRGGEEREGTEAVGSRRPAGRTASSAVVLRRVVTRGRGEAGGVEVMIRLNCGCEGLVE